MSMPTPTAPISPIIPNIEKAPATAPGLEKKLRRVRFCLRILKKNIAYPDEVLEVEVELLEAGPPVTTLEGYRDLPF